MEDKNCPKIINCPVFQQNVLYDVETNTSFRSLFCNAGMERFSECKRYQATEKTGKMVPEFILPNSKLTIHEIIQIMASSLN